MKKFITELSSSKGQYGSIVATVHDKHGNLIQSVEQTVDSFNDQIWKMYQRNLAGVGTVSVVDLLNNTDASVDSDVNIKHVDGPINTYSGIVVGTGTNPTTISKVVMDTLIQHGSSNGQLAAQMITTEWDTTNGIATLTRPFVNLSANAATITVNEVGIALGISADSAATSAYLVVRDLLQTGLNVPFEATLVVQYKIRISNGTNNYKNVFIKVFGSTSSSSNEFRYGMTNTNGNLITTIGGASARIFSSEGMTNRGLVFGTSNNAFNVTQIDLGSRIAHGNSAGQLFYHSTTNGSIEINTSTNSLFYKFFRSIENRSGSNIQIKEAALFTDQEQGGVQSFMLDRRVIDPPVTITNGNIISFTWEFCYEV